MGPLPKIALACLATLTTGALGAQAPVERLPPQPPPPAYQAAPPPPLEGLGQPPGAADALAGLTSQPASHTSFSFDRDMLQSLLGNQSLGVNAVTVTNFRYHEPAFYVPEALEALRESYSAAGWKHLVEANVSRREQASPVKPITDLWLHFHGAEIDDVTVLIRAPRMMNVIEVSGTMRPLDLMHLGGKFGIPKVDPGTVMVPAPPGH